MSARILLVEDNPTNLALMEYLLRTFGHTVLTAADGAEGVGLAQRERPHIILMDLQMPRLNGFEAASQLKTDPLFSQTPIVAVTAFAMTEDRTKVLTHGAFDGYIAKPIAPDRFVSQVEAFLPAELRGPSPNGRPRT